MELDVYKGKRSLCSDSALGYNWCPASFTLTFTSQPGVYSTLTPLLARCYALHLSQSNSTSRVNM